MNKIITYEKQTVPPDPYNYLPSLIENAVEADILNTYEMNSFQLSLLKLIKRQCLRYNGSDTSSIPADTAKLVSEGVVYHIELYLKSLNDPIQAVKEIKENLLDELYEKGKKRARNLLDKSKLFYSAIAKEPFQTENINYTLNLKKVIPAFFKNYDYIFLPQIKSEFIIYSTAFFAAYEHIQAMEFIYRYLQDLYTENQFLNLFEQKAVDRLLFSYSPSYKDEVFNIFTLVLQNVYACICSGTDPYALKPGKEMQTTQVSPDTLIASLDIQSEHLQAYIRKMPVSGVHTPIKEKKNSEIIISLKNQMADDKFRFLLYLIQKEKDIQKKINMVKTGIGNIKDLCDLLETECFEPKELLLLYKSLETIELSALIKYGNLSTAEDTETIWTVQLLEYIKMLPESDRTYLYSLSESIVFKN